LAFIFASFRNSSKDRLSYAKQTISELQQYYDQGNPLEITVWRTKKRVSVLEFEQAKNILKLLETHQDWRVRVECSHYLQIYGSDESLVDGFVKNCKPKEIFKPEPGTENFLLLNIDTAVVKNPSEYEYRVYLKGGKMDTSFANWLKANRDKSKVGDLTLRNIENGWYLSGNYFYVRDDKVLTIVRMLIGHNVRRVEKLIYKGDIDKYTYDDKQ
jgi:hypothetical protein